MEGQVKAVSQKEGKYGINIEGIWYNGFGNAPCKKGDIIKLEFITTESNGRTFNNISKVEMVKEGEKQVEKGNFEDANRAKQASMIISYAKDMAVAGIIKAEELANYAHSLMNLHDELVKPKEVKTEIPVSEIRRTTQTIKPNEM